MVHDSAADGNRDAKKKRRKEPLTMEFERIPDFGNAFNPAKNTSKLTTNTLIQWLPEKVTLPEDLNFDFKEFTQWVIYRLRALLAVLLFLS